MKKYNLCFAAVLLSVLLCSAHPSLAQRVSYEALQAREWVPSAYFEYNVLPPSSPGENPELIVSFKIEYDFLTFRRTGQNTDDERRFYSDVEIGIEIFKPEITDDENGQLARRSATRIQNAPGTPRRRGGRSASEELQNRQSVGRDFWSGTAYAATYEQTQSKSQYLEGYIRKQLPPGTYDVVGRFTADRNTRNTGIRRTVIPDFNDRHQAQIYFLDETGEVTPPAETPLINMGRNVFYGKDFNALFMIPGFDENATYRIKLEKLDLNSRDTTAVSTVFDEPVAAENIHSGLNLEVSASDTRSVNLVMQEGDSPYTFALKTIPNSRFENAHYRIEFTKEGEDSPLGSRIFLNRWVDIPTSLLNVDVALSMLRYIVDDETFSRLRRGSEQEREQRFREFWKERDPTPESEYNELMVEYYRRIDHAYENFTTPTQPGYESDKGRTYIRNGEPDNIIRRFPSNSPAVVVWEYGGRSFTFVATTGFGDYELRERS